VSRGTAAVCAALGLAAAAGWWMAQRRESPFAVELVAPGLTKPGAREVAGSWSEGGRTRAVRLRARNAASGAPLPADAGVARDPTLEFAIEDASDAAPLARLLLVDPAAAAYYHAASRHPTLGTELLRSRLARVRGGAAPERAALLLDAGAYADPAVRLPLREIGDEAAPGLLAAAIALGAFEVLAEGGFVRDADGRPRLPPFRPGAPDWTRLRGSSLASYLSQADASHLAARPQLVAAARAQLAAHLDALPELAESLETSAADLAPGAGAKAVAALVETLAGNVRALRAHLDSAWIESIATLTEPDRLQIDFFVHSLVPVELAAFVAELPQRLLLLEKHALAGLALRALPDGEPVTARTQRGGLAFPLATRVEPVPLGAYRFRSTQLAFELTGLAASPRLRDGLLAALRPRVVDAHRGVELDAQHVSRLAAIADPRYGHAAEEDLDAFLAGLSARLRGGTRRSTRFDPDRRTLVLGAGAYDVVQDLIPPPGVGLRLEAGVELRLHPGRSILLRGPLQVAGSAARPVRIHAALPGRPWGVLALQGADVRGVGAEPPHSRIRHLLLEGGSQDELRGASYLGQLSVHHQRLLLEHSTLRDSHADDSLNARYASVTIRDCVFLDSAADAVDLDWVDGAIERSLFSGSGPEGDGLDLSGSRVEVTDSVFADARDKCLSVGERSRLTLRGALLRGCALGVASKDLSEAHIERSVFLGNDRDLAAYRKKAVFGGGRIRASDVVLAGSRLGSQRDAESEIAVDAAVWLGGEAGDVTAEASRFLPPEAAGAGGLAGAPLATARAFSAADYRRLRAELP
jgi:hypothetical protein